MITFENTKKYSSIDFEEYLKFKGYSHSFLKREQNGVSPEFVPTNAVKFGSLVDELLTEPEKVDISNPMYGFAKDVGLAVMQFFGNEIWNAMESQLCFTTEMRMNGLIMPFKGRLDKFDARGKMVVDLKITQSPIKQIPTLIDYMGYKNQLWGYGKPLGAERGLLIFYSTKDKKPFMYPFKFEERNAFFEEKVLNFGV
jgi:hypothetical protein